MNFERCCLGPCEANAQTPHRSWSTLNDIWCSRVRAKCFPLYMCYKGEFDDDCPIPHTIDQHYAGRSG
jgi:hypothetical protein